MGGSGADSLSGVSGADGFVFSFLSGVDLLDFTPGRDLILMDIFVMTGLGDAGTLSSAAFHVADGAVFGYDASDRVIYNTTSGARAHTAVLIL